MRLMARDVALLLNLSEKTIYKLAGRGEIPAYRLKDQYYFSKPEVLEWANEQKIAVSGDLTGGALQDSEQLPNISDAISRGGIFHGVAGGDMEGALRSVVDLLELPSDCDRAFLVKILIAREALGSTGIGDGIAIPHVRNPIVLNVDDPMIALAFLKDAIDFGAIDGRPVKVLFTIISSTVRQHLHLLSRLSYILRDLSVKDALARELPKDEIMTIFKNAEMALAPAPQGAPK